MFENPPAGDELADTTIELDEDLTTAEEPRVAVAPPRWTPPAPPEHRSSLVPRWLPIVAGALVLVVALTAGLIAWRSGSTMARVPDVAGLDPSVAEQRLKAAGFTLVQGDRRFSSDVPSGYILEQDPAAGAEAPSGSAIVVAISAGSERLPMPDVVGKAIDIAKSILQSHGLNVVLQPTPSAEVSGTVVMSYPSAGVTISTGDTVRLSVASSEASGDLLLPTDLRGRSFVIDPSPMPTANSTADPAADVTRRLRALLEASGATVVVTRDAADGAGGVSIDQRIQRSRAVPHTAIIGLEVSATGAPGIKVRSVPDLKETSGHYLGSVALAQSAKQALEAAFPNVATQVGQDDVILIQGRAPAIRVMLGTASAPADSRQWADPQWADNVARAIYRSIARTYGND